MTRAEAFEVMRQRGGTPSGTVTKQTKLLIVGELGWPSLDDGRPSNKAQSRNCLWHSSGERTPLSRMDWEGHPRQRPEDLFDRSNCRSMQAVRRHDTKARAIGSAG